MGVHEELRKLTDDHLGTEGLSHCTITQIAHDGSPPLLLMEIRVWLPQDWAYKPEPSPRRDAPTDALTAADLRDLVNIANQAMGTRPTARLLEIEAKLGK